MDPISTLVAAPASMVFLALALSTGGVQEIPFNEISACWSARVKLGGECVHRTYGLIQTWPQEKTVWIRMRAWAGEPPKSGTVMAEFPLIARHLVNTGWAKRVDKPLDSMDKPSE